MARMGGNENDCSGNARPAVRVLVVEPCAPQGIEAWARAGFIVWPGAEFDRSRNGAADRQGPAA